MDHLVDLKALLVEKEDCDSGTVTKVREGLAQGGAQFRTLKEIVGTLQKRLEGSTGTATKKWRLRLGIANFFLGHIPAAAEHLQQAEGALANFYLGRCMASLGNSDEALAAFERAEKAGYNPGQVKLQRTGIYRKQGNITKARAVLTELKDFATHSAEYHFQLASCHLVEGEKIKAVEHYEEAIRFDPGHTGALFQLGHLNDLAGNDEDAIRYYERCLKHPPIHIGALNNLGVLYEDNDKYEDAAKCYQRLLNAHPRDEDDRERARLFLKDAQASVTMYYNPEEEATFSRFSQVLEIPVTDFELSVRARNCLRKMNIKTLGDLTRISEQQLLGSKNFGETSLQEIKDMLTAKGLHLGQSIEEGSKPPETRPRPHTPHHQPANEQEAAMMNKSVADLNLSVRARKCMTRFGIETFGDLIQRTSDELLEAKNFGMTSLNEVKDKLAQYGLHLRGD